MISCEVVDFGDRTGAASPAGRLERKGKGGYTLLAAGLFAYLGISAYSNTKKGRQLIPYPAGR